MLTPFQIFPISDKLKGNLALSARRILIII